ncbi:hypothetical protein [Burkholderia pseudomallei]|uniref:hypothetical protein n=1 Tax=Burkholderia pseudomallei TaxID=28450 RepID=UPI003F65CD5B
MFVQCSSSRRNRIAGSAHSGRMPGTRLRPDIVLASLILPIPAALSRGGVLAGIAAGIATSQRAKRDAAPLRSSAHARPGIPEIRTTDCGVFRPL